MNSLGAHPAPRPKVPRGGEGAGATLLPCARSPIRARKSWGRARGSEGAARRGNGSDAACSPTPVKGG